MQAAIGFIATRVISLTCRALLDIITQIMSSLVQGKTLYSVKATFKALVAVFIIDYFKQFLIHGSGQEQPLVFNNIRISNSTFEHVE